MQNLMCLSVFLLVGSLFSADLNEHKALHRVEAHLVIGDERGALQEIQDVFPLYPDSCPLLKNLIRIHAKMSSEREMMEAWQRYAKLVPESEWDHELIEEMAWGILYKTSKSSALPLRQMTLLAAYYTQDGKGVALLERGMRDPNDSIRASAVKFSAAFRDKNLALEVIRLFREEAKWEVRKEVLSAVGQMKIHSLEPELKKMIAQERSSASEKALAIQSLIHLWDGINRAETEFLSKSSRAGLRELCCEAIGHFRSERDLDLLDVLSTDSQRDVKGAAYRALGKIRAKNEKSRVVEIAKRGVKDPHPESALSAAWLWMLEDPERASPIFTSFLQTPNDTIQLMASGILAKTGPQGQPLALEQFRIHSNPFVKLNLALGLIDLRMALDETVPYVRQFLLNTPGKLAKGHLGHFEWIKLSNVEESEDLEIEPNAENILIRLELSNLLAIFEDPGALETMKSFLNDRSKGIAQTTTVLLLCEGDEAALDLVRGVLNDSHPSIRLQAALILALWGREESVIKMLEEEYQRCDWDEKTHILQALGRIGSIKTLPFLINVLNEQAQSLRLIGALALIQTLNH